MTPTVTNKLIQTREFYARDVSDMARIMNELMQARFTGKVTIHVNMGGIQAVTSEAVKKLAS